ncbi:hypothetical protein [Halovivax gelatinilyticus]|uniref:hypothetical protein n=1 Tax=Halovivax gelatinilyticus TaxID=2961597 RepID=UPI0020CA81F5|nr:hypothetical protein [Halovivax gelatinilyticus]
MIEWEVGPDHLHIVDTDSTELPVSGNLSAVRDSDVAVSRPVDAVLEATASELRFPHAVVYARSTESDAHYELGPGGEPLELPRGEYLIDVDTEIKTYIRVAGPVRIERTADFESVIVSFPDRLPIVLGFRSRHEFPTGTITVPETPAGLARAVSHLSSSHKTSSPDRTYPTLRGHPPLIELGETLEIPDHLASQRSRCSGIELQLPNEFEAVFVTAPLAYYLQADVVTATVEHPILRLTDTGRELTLGPTGLERDVERLLRKTFFLDCLVRNAGPYGTNLSELRLLDVLELDAKRLYDATPAERLDAYLDVPYEAIEHRLPEWHLAMYVEPSPRRAEAIPFLLDRMSLCFTPRTSELDGSELVERSLEDFYRGNPVGRLADPPQRTRSMGGEVSSVDIVKPELRSAKAHGWLADGVPIDVFKCSQEAYYNRLEFLDTPSDETTICVVLNDPEMAGEHADVYDIYHDRSEELSIDVRVREGCTVTELRDIFESPIDFVHYIGHCESDGLRCPDGYFSAKSLDTCGVETFFLNACGSFHEGTELLTKGSVAGAVTFTQVLNDHAIKVGSTFAKLLVNGFSIERAMGLARRRIMMGKDYAVVGDGTHTLTQGDHRTPTTIALERLEDDRYLLTLECYSTQATGSYYFPHTAGNEYASLCGNESNFVLDREELVTFLTESEAPVIYDGDLYWSQDLWPTLRV